MDRSAYKPQTVAAAKQQLLAASTPKHDYLESIKKHPTASVVAAVAGGILLPQLVKKGGFPPSLLSLGIMLLKKL